MRLFVAELLRFWTRRLVLISVPILIVISAAIAVPTALLAYPVSASEQAQAQRDFDREHASWAQECPQQDASKCDISEPVLEDYLRTPTSLKDALGWNSSLKQTLINLLCLLIGTSFVAAEFRAGTMSTWLTFNSNRNLVYLTKLGAAVVSTAVITALSAATTVASLAITAVIGTVPLDLPGIWPLIGWTAVGGALFAAVAVGIGMITRHTVAGLGIGIVISFLEGIASLVLMFLPGMGWLAKYLPGTQLGALFANGSQVTVMTDLDAGSLEMVPISAGEAALYWLVLASVITAVGMVTFDRREVR
jgi:ABC-2 type transport system permease protein